MRAKEVMDLYESILKETAALKLVCIFHGANKTTGLWRTYPNAVIYESVKGMEASKLLDRATHETTIPFTRMIAGPADYSVCHFGARRQNTTWVHQAATAAIYSAPVITYAATPANILANPCVEMIKSIPAVWDETIVLPPSEIGELAVYAQRKGTTWVRTTGSPSRGRAGARRRRRQAVGRPVLLDRREDGLREALLPGDREVHAVAAAPLARRQGRRRS